MTHRVRARAVRLLRSPGHSLAALAFIASSALGSGCVFAERHTRLKMTAEALSKSADECLLDVRDRKLKYETSPNCTAT